MTFLRCMDAGTVFTYSLQAAGEDVMADSGKGGSRLRDATVGAIVCGAVFAVLGVFDRGVPAGLQSAVFTGILGAVFGGSKKDKTGMPDKDDMTK